MKISHKAARILETSNDAATFVEQIVSRFYDKAMEARTVLDEKGYDAAWDDLLKRYMPPYSDLGVPYIGIEVALWKEEVVEEVAAFPFGPNDDHVDSTVMALLRFRQGGFIALPTDEVDEVEYSMPMREGYY